VSRPWIEFLQSQRLPWQPGWFAELRPGADVKVLSVDDEGGAVSLIVRYPPGYVAPATALAVDDELLVLEGALNVGHAVHGPLAYSHLPAGFDSGEWRSPQGAVVLEFFSGHPLRSAATVAGGDKRIVVGLEAMSVPYTGNFHPEFPPGAGRKILFQDPDSLDTTWLLGTLPLRWAERAEVHPTVEEMYLLAGEVHGNRGVMRPGAYFWRPAGQIHGPYGTRTGNLYLFRTKGGGLSTTYVDASRPFRWWPSYEPVLPPHLQAYAGETVTGASSW
jgi:Domain of unknown function (DUF4437)